MKSVFSAMVAVFALSGCFPARVETQVGDLRVLTLQHDYSNAHVLVGRGGALLMIDSGLEANALALEADLRARGLDPQKLEAIVITHAHADHAGGARKLRERFGAKLVIGAGDASMLASGRNDTLCPTGDDARKRLADDQAQTFVGSKADLEISTPTSLSSFSSFSGEVTPLPGHTPGSLVVRVGEAVFVGDLLRGSVFGKDATTHFYMCDLEDNRNDVRTALDVLAPSAQTWFVGHFGPLSRAAVQKTFSTLPAQETAQ
jgi:hydroxyacylglutathione hydrolase